MKNKEQVNFTHDVLKWSVFGAAAMLILAITSGFRGMWGLLTITALLFVMWSAIAISEFRSRVTKHDER